MFCTVTDTIIDKSQALNEEDYKRCEELFYTLCTNLKYYIRNQSLSKAAKGVNGGLDVDDYESIGLIHTWAAILDFDSTKHISIESWAKRRIWSNMSVLLSNSQQQKRVPHEGDNIYRPTSLSYEGVDGNSLDSHVEDILVEPSIDMEYNEVYQSVYKKLLSMKNRIACAVLRLIINPDAELLSLCGDVHKVKITNRCIAARLGVLPANITTAKRQIEKFVGEYSKKAETEAKCVACTYRKVCRKWKACIKCTGKDICVGDTYNNCERDKEYQSCNMLVQKQSVVM